MRVYIETSDYKVVYLNMGLSFVKDNRDTGMVECKQSVIGITIINGDDVVQSIPFNKGWLDKINEVEGAMVEKEPGDWY